MVSSYHQAAAAALVPMTNTDIIVHSLVPILIPTFSMLHAEKGEGLVDLVMSG